MTTDSEPRGPSGATILVVVLALLGAMVLFGNRACMVRDFPFDFHFNDFGWRGMSYSLFGIWTAIQVGLALWVGFDANRRGFNGWLWGLLVLVTPIVGLIIYLIAAPLLQSSNRDAERPWTSEPTTRSVELRHCTQCRAPLESGFKVCPQCGTSTGCRECGRTLRSGWKHCPFCGTPAAPAGDQPAG